MLRICRLRRDQGLARPTAARHARERSLPLTQMTPVPPGTIGLVHTGGFAGWVIRVATEDRWNHVILAGLDCIYEAVPRRGYIRSSPHAYTEGVDLTWLRAEVLTDGQRMRRVDAAIDRLGLPYNWPAIAAIALRKFDLWFDWLNRWSTGRKHVMCSEAVTEIVREAGSELFSDRLPSTVTPGDIDYFYRLRGI